MNNKNFLRKWSLGITGCDCWAVSIGESTGSRFIMDIGSKVERETPSSNPMCTDEERNFYGFYSLHVGCAAWRLTDSKAIIASWSESNANDGNMVYQMKKLIHSKITKVEVDKLFYDIVIQFSNNRVLYVFCDQIEPEGDNYTVSIERDYLEVGPGLQLDFEKGEK